MGDKPKAAKANEKVPVGMRILYFLGMAFYLLLSSLFCLVIYSHLVISPGGINTIYAVLFGLCLMGALFSSFLFGYRAFMSAKRQGWIQRKLKNIALLISLCVLLVWVGFPSLEATLSQSLDSHAKSNLHNLYQKCKVYWETQGVDQECSISIASRPEYGFVQTLWAKSIEGHGTRATFTASTQSYSGNRVFTLDENGNVVEDLEKQLENSLKLSTRGNKDLANTLKRAQQGNPQAQYDLGVMYANGQGVPQDFKEAVKWYKLSAEQENAQAQHILGFMHAYGQGVPQGYKEAVRWYRLSAEQGYAYAQYNLGDLYTNGQGVPQDYIQAHKWLNLAGASGYEYGLKNRIILEKQMTPSQIEKAKKLAREWKPKPNKSKGM